MDQDIITIGVSKDTSMSDTKAIREQFKIDNHNNKLNIVIGGEDDLKISLSDFITARLNT